MSRQQKNINLEPRDSAAVLLTDGAGAIAFRGTPAQRSSDVTAVAFTTDGTNGSVLVSFVSKGTVAYVPKATVLLPSNAPGIIAPVSLTPVGFTFIVYDAATPTAINLATTIATIYLELSHSLPS